MGTEELNLTQLNSMSDEFAPPNGPGAAGSMSPSRTASIAESHRRINLPNLVLAGLFVAGIACLYLLSLRTGPQKVSAEEQTVEARVDAALQVLGVPDATRHQRETSAIVDTFYYEAAQRQVPLERIRTNPFRYHPAADEADTSTGNSEAEAPAEHEDVRQAVEAARKLQLQSVLSGAGKPSAMISNNLITEGQVISGWTVAEIQSRQVILTWRDRQFILQMPR